MTLPTAALGRRGLHVTRVALGGGPLGNLFTAIDDDTATAVVDAAWDAGVRCFDTAPLYGHGLSEQRLGRALQRYPRDEFVLSTKVGRVLDPDAGFDPGIFAVPRDLAPVFDYSRDGILRSVDDSLTRLGLDRIDVALVHDPDDHEADALAGAFPTLLELREQGVVQAVGSGMNQGEMLARFTARVDLDCVLLAGRYTLLDRSGARFLDKCADLGIGVLLGGVFNSGVLATDARPPTFDYLPASEDVVRRAGRLRELCAGHGVALPHAAIDFALRRRGVTALVLGAGTADEVVADATWAQAPIPDALRAELDAFA